MTLSKAQLDELRTLYDVAPKGTWHMDGEHAYIFEEGQRRYVLNPSQPASKLLVAVMNMLPDLLSELHRGVWIDHDGSDECPVAGMTMVRVKEGNWSSSEYCHAKDWQWSEYVTHYMIAPDT